MTYRPILTIAAASIILAACGGGDSDGAETTPPEVTLITNPPEVSVPQTSDPEPEPTPDSGPVTAESTVPETEVPTTVEAPAVTTTEVPTTVATTTPPDETTTVETTPVETTPDPVGGEFELSADGLGAVQFGADPEQTITFVTSVIGPPTSDTGWVDPFEIGPCGGTRIRQVNWNQLKLEFGDVSDVIQGRDHFYAYFYGVEGSSTPEPAGLTTAENIGAGSTVASLLAAYPGAQLRLGDEFIGPSFTINDNLLGRISGVSDTDVVEAFIGGRPCDG